MTAKQSSATVRGTSSVQEQHWARRAVPPREEVRPGIWAVPVPAPGNPIRFTYAYVISAAGGAIVLDPGADSAESWQALTSALAGIGVDSVQGIVVSHFHFDHWQMADRLSRTHRAWVALSRTEHTWIAGLDAVHLASEAHERFLAWGVPTGEVDELVATEDYGDTLRYAAPDLLLDDGDTLPGAGHLEVLVTPGHSPGHLCLYDGSHELLFSGDHVLPRITPYVAMNPYGPANPLRCYLNSIARLRRYAGAEVLPAHEYRFTGLLGRIEELEAAVAHRLREVRAAVDAEPGLSAWAIAGRLTWSRSWECFSAQARKMALSETAAHLALLDAE